ncbi:hypothetical protein PFICI_00271 [Pestalotiopsis fici W106-1]|uniref:Uncharacterized protein n=1 Tax=Pestalotiopsis fici (strain W106-1 / CGMCC3.15140) TaxID=1229662 RepID=W3XK73_PESFW|nr:uncharacterized protein PFICI_00271 [Pestalotiopsis fici W106-1]ETS86443.1 hypothetical protein PFICI_00271 [Pestalotiopsis fici W106-1]
MSANENVEVKSSGNSETGRGLFASKDFKPGDVVLSVDRPLVAELDMDRMSDSCAWCFQRGATDPMERQSSAAMGLPAGFIECKACSGCRRVSYCSKKCQSKAWKAEHKYECKVLAPSERPALPDAVRAVIKLLGRLKAEGDKDGRTKELLSFFPFAGGQGLEEFARRDKKLFDDLSMMGFAAWKYVGEPNLPGVDSQNIAKAFTFNILCNKFGLSSPLDDTHLGIGFDPLICTSNHSCDPNVNLVFNQPTTVLRALKPIKKGEEILMKYIDVTNPYSVRQAELSETYHFTCKCSKCKKGATDREDIFSKPASELSSEYRKRADALVARHEKQLARFLVPGGNEADQKRLAALQAEAFSVSGTLTDVRDPSLEEIKDTLKMCIDSGLWTWTRQPVPRLCHQLFAKYIATGDPYGAFRIGLKLYFEISPSLYPQTFSSDRLVDSWAMSTVTNVLCGPMSKEVYDEFMQNGVDLRIAYFGFLFAVHDDMPKMFGVDSPFGKVVESTYSQIMAGVTIHESEIRDKVKTLWPSLEMIGRSVTVQSL